MGQVTVWVLIGIQSSKHFCSCGVMDIPTCRVIGIFSTVIGIESSEYCCSSTMSVVWYLFIFWAVISSQSSKDTGRSTLVVVLYEVAFRTVISSENREYPSSSYWNNRGLYNLGWCVWHCSWTVNQLLIAVICTFLFLQLYFNFVSVHTFDRYYTVNFHLLVACYAWQTPSVVYVTTAEVSNILGLR